MSKTLDNAGHEIDDFLNPVVGSVMRWDWTGAVDEEFGHPDSIVHPESHEAIHRQCHDAQFLQSRWWFCAK